MPNRFESIYSHGFARVAVCLPHVQPADPHSNLAATLELCRRASESGSVLALFPELGLSGYALDDLHQQDALLESVATSLWSLLDSSRDLHPLLIVGAPIRVEHRLYNCAVLMLRGMLLGVVPKSYLPNYREYYEKRQFTAGRDAIAHDIFLCGQNVPFGNDLIFESTSIPSLSIGVEICEDLWAPIPPSTYQALGGASILCNLSASNITIAKAEYRRTLISSHSGRCNAAYLYAGAGHGESTTDLAWDGHGLIYEVSERIAESDRFSLEPQIILGDIDLERIRNDRMRITSFNDAATDHRARIQSLRRIRFHLQPPNGVISFYRHVERYPFVPVDDSQRDERCYEAWNIQVSSLVRRMEATGISTLVIGVSGGLDSTHALIVAARSMDKLGLPRARVLAWTMPGFATSPRTYHNAHALMKALGVTVGDIDIKPSAMQMFRDIGHPFADGVQQFDVTFENVQAGERTSHLFRLANRHNGLVVGTGDLSELALGWTTYGVGDHMSHYNVNVSVPKTLVRHLIRWASRSEEFDEATSAILQSILATEISPELIPGDRAVSGPAQKTEDIIGPYDLQDFNLYYISRYGFRPGKVAFLAWHAWRTMDDPSWPDGIADSDKREYDLKSILRWLEVFLYRFFQTSQFKRSCIPNGPKVGSGGSLSPRGDWRAPSDVVAEVWLRDLRETLATIDDGAGQSTG